MKLSENFDLAEFEMSNFATRKGYENRVPKKLVSNVRRLVKTILQPLREEVGSVIHVNSGYRSARVNAGIGGSKNSAHMKGLAADIWTPELTPRALTQLLIDLELPYDTVIHEFGRWTHVAAPAARKKPRRRVLTAHKVGNNQTRYADGNLAVNRRRMLA